MEGNNITNVRNGNNNVYHFVCEGCGSEGELELPIDRHSPFGCPEGCGATYIQWQNPDGKMQLTCVVAPVFK